MLFGAALRAGGCGVRCAQLTALRGASLRTGGCGARCAQLTALRGAALRTGSCRGLRCALLGPSGLTAAELPPGPLPHTLLRLLVLPQPLERGMAHPAVLGPL